MNVASATLLAPSFMLMARHKENSRPLTRSQCPLSAAGCAHKESVYIEFYMLDRVARVDHATASAASPFFVGSILMGRSRHVDLHAKAKQYKSGPPLFFTIGIDDVVIGNCTRVLSRQLRPDLGGEGHHERVSRNEIKRESVRHPISDEATAANVTNDANQFRHSSAAQ